MERFEKDIISNDFTAAKESVSERYDDAFCNAAWAVVAGIAGGTVIKNAVGAQNRIYMAAACLLTAASVGYFLLRGFGDYSTARVLNMELRKKQKALAQNTTEQVKQNTK